MSKQFGKTWWGQQWLNSLAHIDYDNRLPRGSAYAKKGAVEQLAIEGNMIHAKVAGSRPKPYEVTIVIPPFFEKETKELIAGIAKKPVIISKLLRDKKQITYNNILFSTRIYSSILEESH